MSSTFFSMNSQTHCCRLLTMLEMALNPCTFLSLLSLDFPRVWYEARIDVQWRQLHVTADTDPDFAMPVPSWCRIGCALGYSVPEWWYPTTLKWKAMLVTYISKRNFNLILSNLNLHMCWRSCVPWSGPE